MIKKLLIYFPIVLVLILLVGSLVCAISSSIESDVIETEDFSIDFIKIKEPFSFQESVTDYLDFINRTYPLADNAIKHSGLPGSLNFEEESDKFMILKSIRLRSFLSSSFSDVSVGIVPEDWFSDNTTGFAFVQNSLLKSSVSPNSVVVVENDRSVTAHEVGHVYGFCDEYDGVAWNEQNTFLGENLCPNGDKDGDETLDDECENNGGCNGTTFGELIPWIDQNGEIEVFNFMGFSGREDAWVTEETYNYLINQLSPNLIEIDSRLLVSGLYNLSSNSAEFSSFYQIGEGLAFNETFYDEGNFTLNSYYENGTILSQFTFDLSFLIAFSGSNQTELTNVTPFVLLVPFSSEFGNITFIKNNSVLDQVNRTPNIPTLSITLNLSGKVFEQNELFNVSWDSSDADNDSLVYGILVSDNDGLSYVTLEMDYNQTNITLNSSNLPYCNFCKIKVLSTDGVNTNSSISDTFSIPPQSIFNFSILNTSSLNTVFEFGILDDNFVSSSFPFKFKFGDGNNFSNILDVNLNNSEDIFVIIEHNYTSGGIKILSANVTVGEFYDIEYLEVTI